MTSKPNQESAESRQTPTYQKVIITFICAWIGFFLIGLVLGEPGMLFNVWGLLISSGLAIASIFAYDQITDAISSITEWFVRDD